MSKIRIRCWTFWDNYPVAYYWVKGGKIYRLDFALLDFFKTWEDLQHCDGEVPGVGW